MTKRQLFQFALNYVPVGFVWKRDLTFHITKSLKYFLSNWQKFRASWKKFELKTISLLATTYFEYFQK